MARILGVFVAWNTTSMMLCCGANIVGLRFPPKWLYYNTLLYDFYKRYDASQGRAFDEGAQVSARGRKSWWLNIGWGLRTRTPTPGVQTPKARSPAGPIPLGEQTSGGRTPSALTPVAVVAGARTATRKQKKPTSGGKTPRLQSPPPPGVRAGTGSAVPVSKKTPRAGAAAKSAGEEGGTTTSAGTTTLSKTKNKLKKRVIATPATPPRASTKQRKLKQGDRAGAGGTAYEPSAASSGTSSAKTVQDIEDAGGLASEVSNATTPSQVAPDDLVDTEVSVVTSASQGSTADSAKRGIGGAAPSRQPGGSLRDASPATPSRMLGLHGATEDVRTATSSASTSRSTYRGALDGRTPRQPEANVLAGQVGGTPAVMPSPRVVQRTDEAENVKGAGRLKPPEPTGRTPSRRKP
ncbi:hypothetical protein HPB50_025419 [Hyalomma asiaticum]|uniref:Uncharacterized protein n=1 Tax=Hyalomma asiaticum TaxID=266040 RepID=A0ACB7SPG2_HYAAI|nr:hypothetical protein HPB50_025419 [Hyalomma asiaticum]